MTLLLRSAGGPTRKFVSERFPGGLNFNTNARKSYKQNHGMFVHKNRMSMLPGAMEKGMFEKSTMRILKLLGTFLRFSGFHRLVNYYYYVLTVCEYWMCTSIL